MHTIEDITIDSITKIEGNAELKVKLEDGVVTDLQFIISDYRRFYSEAVKGKPYMTVPSLLSRICGTCSVAHLLASIKAIEKALGIHDQITDQTKLIRKLTVNGMIIRDHALHLYLFSLPDVLKIDSVLDIPDDDSLQHQLLHDAFDLKALGNKLSTVFAGAAVHAPYPVVGGFLKIPENVDKDGLIKELEAAREKAMRGIKIFALWDAELHEGTDFVALVSPDFNFTEGEIKINNEITYKEEDFVNLFEEVIIPYSQSRSYKIKSLHEDFLVGALARLNLNKDNLHQKTKETAQEYLKIFPSTNIFHNCLAQAIEILHCIDQSIEILSNLNLVQEKPIQAIPKAGIGVGVIEAPRGILYHKAVTDEKGLIVESDVIVPTSQNQMNIENSIKRMFNENINKVSREQLKWEAEKIIRAYDPCMSCSTNFLKVTWEE